MSAVATPPPTENAVAPAAPKRKFWRRKSGDAAPPKTRLAPKQRLAILLVACSSFTMLPLLWYVAQARLNPPAGPEKPKIALADALAALDKGRFQEAGRLLEELRKHDLLTDDDRGGVAYIRGMLAAQDAERMWDRDRVRIAREAVRHLATAHSHGVPTGHESVALRALCEMLVAAGHESEARPSLDKALADESLEKTELHRLAAIAWSAEPKPDYSRALQENEAYLADRTLLSTPRQDGLLQRAKTLFRMNRIDQCRATLHEIRPDATAALEGLLLEAEVEIDAARRSAKDDEVRKVAYRKAIEILGRALLSGNGRENVQRRALYLTGVCQREAGDPRTARETFQKTRLTYLQSSEGVAAAIAEVALDRELGLDDDVVPTLIEAVKAAGDAADYHNPLLSFEDLREVVIAAYRRQTNLRDYESAGKLARAAGGILSPESALELSALAYVARAESMLDDIRRPLASPHRKSLARGGRAVSLGRRRLHLVVETGVRESGLFGNGLEGRRRLSVGKRLRDRARAFARIFDI
ncbi:MAG: tetratricopeptide repeat protein [Pirellulales bacterium]